MTDILVRDAAVAIINEFGLGSAAITFLSLVSVWAVSNYLTWIEARVLYNQYEEDIKANDAAIQMRFEMIQSKLADVFTDAGLRVVSGIRDFGDGIVQDFPNLVRLFLVASVMILIVANHEQIFSSVRRFYQCDAIDLLYPWLNILNFLRLLANAGLPIYNVVIEFMARLGPTDILYRTLKKCAAEGDFYMLLDTVASVFSELAMAVATYFAGNFLEDRLEFYLVAERIGFVANALIPVAECYCDFLLPVFMFVLTALQDPDLHYALDHAVNVFIRVAQIPLSGLINFVVPDFSNLAEEIIGVLTHAGDWIGTTVRGLVNMLSEIISTIIGLLSTAGVAQSLGKTAAVPLNLETGSLTTDTIAVQAGRIEPATLSEVLHAAHRTWASPLATAAPGTGPHMATPLWEIPPESSLNETVGFDRLLLLFYAPWPRIATQTAAAGVTLANQTLNIITHSFNFTDPSALAYFQFGPVFSYLREAMHGLASVSIIFANEVPDFVEAYGDMVLTFYESIPELVTGFVFAIIFPCWRPGENPLGNCNDPPSLAPCDCNVDPSPCNWLTPTCGTFDVFDIFNFFPAYADWSGSALQRSIRYGDTMADAMAVMLDCNATDLNVTNCTSKPFQCVMRTSIRLGMEILNQTHRVLFYVPDLVRFDHTQYHTMQDIALEPIMDLALLLADCATQWIKELDEDHCLVANAPDRYQDPNDGFINAPQFKALSKSELVCGLDGLTYEPDGRLYIYKNTTDNTTAYEQCDFHLNVSSGCLFIGTHESSQTFYAVGDPTVGNMTINIIYPTGVKWYRFDIRSESDFDMSPTVNFTIGPLSDYNLTSVTSTNCTAALPDPLPYPIPPGFSCASYPGDNLRYRPSDNYPTTVAEALTAAGIAEAQVYYFLDGDNDGIFDYNETTFEPLPGESQPATCLIDAIPNLTCLHTQAYTDELCNAKYTPTSDSHDDLFYNGVILHPRLPNGTCYGYNGFTVSPPPTDDYSGVCFGDGVYGSSQNWFTCRYNRLRQKSQLAYTYPGMDALDESMLDSMPLQTFDNHNTEVPCTFTIQDNFFCDANNHSWGHPGITPRALYYAFNNTPPYLPVPCFNNSRKLPTLCRDVELNYTGGRSVHVRLEGQRLTYKVNGVAQTLACDVYKAQSAALGTASLESMDMASILEGYHAPYASATATAPDVNGTYWKTQIANTVRIVRASLTLHMDSLYDKDAFLCCLADVVRHAIRLVVTFVFEWAKFARSILAGPAYAVDSSGYVLELPTFRESKEELRAALCRLACTITRIFPIDLLACPNLQSDMGCGNTATCATGLLCHIFDVPLLLLDIVVDILETIRSLINNESGSNSELNNEACQNGQPIDCIANIIITIITKIIFTITQVFRDLAAFLSCFFCGIGTLLGLGDECTPILYDFVKDLMDLVDGLTSTILTTLIKIIIAIISFFIYLFSGTDNAFDLAIDELGKIFQYFFELIANLALLIIKFLEKIPVIGDVVKFIMNIAGSICSVIQYIVIVFTEPNVDIGCPPYDWSDLKKRGVQGTLYWLTGVRPSIQATWDTELPVCRTRMTQLNNTFYEDLTDSDRLDVFFCLFADHWIHTIEPESGILATVCEQQVLDFYDQRILWSQLVGRVNRAEVQWCGRMRYAMYKLREQGGYDYLPENLLDNPLLFVGLAVQMLYGYDVFAQYSSDRSVPIELLNSAEYVSNWQVAGFGTSQLTALAALPTDEARRMALATDDPALGLELEQYATRMSSTFQFKASALGASARFWGRLFGQEPLYPAASLKRNAVPVPSQSLLVQFLNFTVREVAKQQVLPPPRVNLSLITTQAESVRNRQYIHLGTRAMFKDVPIILAKTAVRAYDMNLTAKATALGTSIPRQMYAGTLAVLKIMSDVTSGRSNPFSAFLARQRPRDSLQYAMTQMTNAASAPMAVVGRGPGQLFQLTSRLWSVSPVARSVRARLSYVANVVAYSIQTAGRADMTQSANLTASGIYCEVPFPDLCETCGILAVPLGTLINAPTQAVAYYAGANDTDPSFGHSYAAYVHTREYLSNLSMPAEIGDSPSNSVRWPYYDRPQTVVLGDTTPNKGRLVNLTTIFWDLVDDLYSVKTLDRIGDAVVSAGSRGVRVLYGTLDYVYNFYSALWTSQSVKQAVGKTTRVTAMTLSSSFLELVEFFKGWFKGCLFREEINGSQKQFSLAEALALQFATVVVIALTINLFIPSSVMTILMTVLSLFGVSTLLTTPFMLAYMYSPGCFPAMPYQAPDDILWTVTRTILPQCDWAWSGIIINDTYDNVQCRICENYDDDTGYVPASCFENSSVTNGVGFQHFGKNIGFTLMHYFPDVVHSWNQTNWPVVSTLIQSSFVQGFFTGFEKYNASDPISFSVHWSCNAMHTALPNYYILLPVFQVLRVALPLAMVGLTLMYGAMPVTYWMYRLAGTCQEATFRLALLAGKGDKADKGTPLGEMANMGRLLGKQVRLAWSRFGQRHRNVYQRY